MNDMNEKFWKEEDYTTEMAIQAIQQYPIGKGLKVFGEAGEKAVQRNSSNSTTENVSNQFYQASYRNSRNYEHK